MATFVFTNAYVSVNGVALSDHVKQVTVDYGAELQDDTAMGDDTRSASGGLKTWSITVEWLQDFAAAKVDATLFSIVGTAIALLVRPTGSSTSATNPEYQGTGVLESYNPLGGSVGDQAMATSTFRAAGTLVRAVS